MEINIRLVVFLVAFITAFGFLAFNLIKLYSYLKIARPENRFDRIFARIKQTLSVAIFQSKILRDKKAGPIHAGIFWGFIVLLFSASEAVLQGFYSNFSWNFLGPFYTAITLSTDLFCLIVAIAVGAAFYRRFIIRVKRLQGDKTETLDAVIVLTSIFIIVTALLIENSAGIILHYNKTWAYRPVSLFLSTLIQNNDAVVIYNLCWWIHILSIFSFMNYLPYSKHLHIYTSLPNVFFSTIGPTNKLDSIDFEQENISKFGVVDIEDFKWKTILDSYSCTHCGRCDSVCPANQTGKILSPRDIIVQIRKRTIERAPEIIKNKKNKSSETSTESDSQSEVETKKFIGDYQSIEALWQCTSCGACMQECPVSIEHVPAIIDMRRSLVMLEADFPQEVQPAYMNLENNFNPWAFSSSERGEWAKEVGVKSAYEHPDFDILFWVGCAGSFDERAKKISKAFSKLMQIANVNFAILGNEEKCCSDPARRSGNEYLANTLIRENIDSLNKYNTKKIVTTCPHCYNSLKNEYPDFSGNYELMHHSQFLQELIKTEKLKLKSYKDTHKISYHDSCYLGRYNSEFDAPRAVVKSVVGENNLINPKRSRDKGFCCGAGGGRMFMEETKGKLVNIERTEELLETGSSEIAVNCPFCMTMISDGVKAKERDDVIVRDIAEILLEQVEIT